jgi:hypothetical protein
MSPNAARAKAATQAPDSQSKSFWITAAPVNVGMAHLALMCSNTPQISH